MVGFKIVALNKKGTEALDQCIQEGNIELSKKSLLDRIKFNKIWIRKTTRNPLTDIWIINPNALRFLRMDPNFSIDIIISEVELAMRSNGAEKDIDYALEVER